MVALWLGVRTIVQGDSPLVDEEQHQRAIHDFVGGRWHAPDELPYIPAFHLLAAGFEALLGHGLFVGRLFSACMAIVGFTAYGFLARRVRGGRWADAFRVYAYQPLLFPLTAMIYTDQTAATFLILMLLAHVSGRFGWAAIALAAATLVRQTNVVWVIVLLAWTVRHAQDVAAAPNGRARIRAALASLAPLWSYGLVMVAAVAVVLATGRLTTGTTPFAQPRFNVDEYYVLFLLVLLLWAPIFVQRAPRDVRSLLRWAVSRPAAALGGTLILTAVIAALARSYSNPDPWNQIGGLVRNWPLTAMDRFPSVRLALLLLCAWSVYQTVRFTLERKDRTVLAVTWGTGLLSLSVMGLVEPRYYIPMLLLADLFNDYDARHAAWLARWYQCVAAAACALALTGRFW